MSEADQELSAKTVFQELSDLVACGCRFHGSQGNHDAARWLCDQLLERTGITPKLQSVDLPAWDPGDKHGLNILQPVQRHIEAWPLLWSGSAEGVVQGKVRYLGITGLWGDSMLWQRFVVVDAHGNVVGYVLSRDEGPAAPQPLPNGFDASLPHLAISHEDGEQLLQWVEDDEEITVSFECNPVSGGHAVSDNIILDIAGSDAHDSKQIIVCAHYDTYYNTRGAYDNGSGTIALLHLAQEFAKSPRPYSIRIIFFTAEEWHLAGSRFYVDHAKELERVHFAYNIDGLGRGDFVELFSAPEALAYQFDLAVKAHNEACGRSMKVTSRFPPTKGTDDASFNMAGVPTVYMTINDKQRLHQPNDLPEAASARNIVWAVALVKDIIDRLPEDNDMSKPAL